MSHVCPTYHDSLRLKSKKERDRLSWEGEKNLPPLFVLIKCRGGVFSALLSDLLDEARGEETGLAGPLESALAPTVVSPPQ